ncbi:hypothetical protein DY000_02019584 [Brassica cretica]|uniref:Uncharacterized protein n=1 Tax=Brassica cretica TaxID=69181 RepID=A0ABQ7CYB4_BRACR|nr:hypothetical protein DY000_02019584 [Brassica cretica]
MDDLRQDEWRVGVPIVPLGLQPGGPIAHESEIGSLEELRVVPGGIVGVRVIGASFCILRELSIGV